MLINGRPEFDVMEFSVGNVLGDAVDRLTTTTGAVLIAGLAVFGLVQSAGSQTFSQRLLERLAAAVDDPAARELLSPEQVDVLLSEMETAAAELPLALELGTVPALLLWFLGLVFTFVVAVVALDTFGNGRETVDGFETDRVGWKTFNLLLGWLVFSILFFVGIVVFVLPGLLLGFFLVFFAAAIAIDGENFFGAFDASSHVVWRNPLGTLAIVILSGVALLVVGLLDGVLAAVLPALLASVVGHLLTALAQAFSLALIALAYVEATRDEADPVAESSEPGGVDEPPGNPA